jgi:hypothetical protein
MNAVARNNGTIPFLHANRILSRLQADSCGFRKTYCVRDNRTHSVATAHEPLRRCFYCVRVSFTITERRLYSVATAHQPLRRFSIASAFQSASQCECCTQRLLRTSHCAGVSIASAFHSPSQCEGCTQRLLRTSHCAGISIASAFHSPSVWRLHSVATAHEPLRRCFYSVRVSFPTLRRLSVTVRIKDSRVRFQMCTQALLLVFSWASSVPSSESTAIRQPMRLFPRYTNHFTTPSYKMSSNGQLNKLSTRRTSN